MRQACQVENRFKALYVKDKLYEVYFKSHSVEPHASNCCQRNDWSARGGSKQPGSARFVQTQFDLSAS